MLKSSETSARGMLANSRAISSFLLLWCMTLVTGAWAQQIPKVDEQSLSGHRVLLPEAVSGKVAVLILGFSRASKEPTSAWGQKLQTDLGKTPGLEIYSMPVLEEVPSLIRGMVISGIKRGVPENQRSHFVPVLHNEASWKKLVNYREPDDAYLVLLDRNGTVAFQMHGALSEQGYEQLRQHIEPLLK
jgi:hypothetical protein